MEDFRVRVNVYRNSPESSNLFSVALDEVIVFGGEN